MRCLVTGATGHVGAALARRLLAEGAEVLALVRPGSSRWRLQGIEDRITLVPGDLADLSALAAQIGQDPPDVTFHLAWHGVTAAYRNDPSQITLNVSGSLRLLEIVQAAGCRCWVGMGSQAEYGPYEGILTETLPPRPVTAYGIAKLCTGLLCAKLCAMAETRFLWFRLLATYGPGDDPRHLLPSVIELLIEGKTPALTAGAQRWDYLYIDDAAQALSHAALHSDAQGIFNLGSGHAVTVREMVEQARELIDPTLSLGFGAIPYRPDQSMLLQADISSLQRETGWSPTIRLEEGLQLTVDWHKSRIKSHFDEGMNQIE